MKKSNKSINKLIFRSFLEIFIVSIFVGVSYRGISTDKYPTKEEIKNEYKENMGMLSDIEDTNNFKDTSIIGYSK